MPISKDHYCELPVAQSGSRLRRLDRATTRA